MSRLDRRSRSEIAQIAEALRPLGRSEGLLEEAVLPRLSRLLDAPAVAYYELEAADGGLHVGQIFSQGLPRRLEPTFRGILERTKGWGFYDARRPQARQRNRAVTRAQLLGPAQESEPMRRFYVQAGLTGLDFVRAVLCDGDHALGWLGGMRTGAPFSARERWVLQALVEPLRDFGLLRRCLQGSSDGALFDALFDAVPQPAFVFDARGRVARANAAGAALLELRPDLKAQLEADARRGRSRQMLLRPVEASGLRRHWVGLVPPEPRCSDTLVAQARAAWSLTPREAQVLRALADGLSNKEAAAALRCSPLTVEVHVKHLLEKTQCASRGALVAALFRVR